MSSSAPVSDMSSSAPVPDVSSSAPVSDMSTALSTFVSGETSLSTMVTDFTTNLADSTTHIYDTYNVFIHPHWRQFPLPTPEWHYIIGIYITVVGFTGIFGNSLVIYIFGRERTLRTPSNMFIVNLAISDLTFSVVNGFPLLSISAFSKKWIFGQAACEFYGMIGGVFGLMSINTMVIIAIDRYFAIAKPLEMSKKMTRKKAFLMIASVWIWSFASSLPPIFGWGRYIPEGFQTSCTFDYLTRTDNNRSYIFFLYLFGFAVPMSIIIICYVRVINAVRKHENEMKKTAKKLNAEMRTNQDKQRMEIKVAKIAMGILVLYLLSWLPYATIALIGQFGDAKFVTPFWSEIPVMFAKASAMHNPIVYALSHPKFRTALHLRLPWLCCCKPLATAKSSKTSGTYRDGSKRSVSSFAAGQSVSSEMSNLEGNYVDLDIRLQRLESDSEEKETRFGGSKRKKYQNSNAAMNESIPAGKIIHDLSQALVEIASRDRAAGQSFKHVDLGAPSTSSKGIDRIKLAADDDRIFVVDSSTLPQLASFLAQMNQQPQGALNKSDEKPAQKSPAKAKPDAGNQVKDNDNKDDDDTAAEDADVKIEPKDTPDNNEKL